MKDKIFGRKRRKTQGEGGVREQVRGKMKGKRMIKGEWENRRDRRRTEEKEVEKEGKKKNENETFYDNKIFCLLLLYSGRKSLESDF
jgi:hypothetical protein